MAIHATEAGLSSGKAIAGITGAFFALALGVAVLIIGAGVAGWQAQDNSAAATGALTAAVGIVPFVAMPILATLLGVWAGTVTRSAGSGAGAGAVGTLLGIIVMAITIVIALAIAAAIGTGLSASDVQQATGVQSQTLMDVGFFASLAGLTYLVVQVLISAIAGAIVGGLMPHARYGPVREEHAERRPTI